MSRAGRARTLSRETGAESVFTAEAEGESQSQPWTVDFFPILHLLRGAGGRSPVRSCAPTSMSPAFYFTHPLATMFPPCSSEQILDGVLNDPTTLSVAPFASWTPSLPPPRYRFQRCAHSPPTNSFQACSTPTPSLRPIGEIFTRNMEQWEKSYRDEGVQLAEGQE